MFICIHNLIMIVLLRPLSLRTNAQQALLQQLSYTISWPHVPIRSRESRSRGSLWPAITATAALLIAIAVIIRCSSQRLALLLVGCLLSRLRLRHPRKFLPGIPHKTRGGGKSTAVWSSSWQIQQYNQRIKLKPSAELFRKCRYSCSRRFAPTSPAQRLIVPVQRYGTHSRRPAPATAQRAPCVSIAITLHTTSMD